MRNSQALGARLKDLQVPVPQCHKHEGAVPRRSDLGHLKTSAWRTTCLVLRGPGMETEGVPLPGFNILCTAAKASTVLG